MNLGAPLQAQSFESSFESQETPGCRCEGPWINVQRALNYTLARSLDRNF